MSVLAEFGVRPVSAFLFLFDRLKIRDIWRYELNIATYDRYPAVDALLCRYHSLFVLVEWERNHPRASDLPSFVTGIKGPSQLERRRPHHLRSRIDARDGMLNHIHTPDEPIDIIREIGVLFDKPVRQELLTYIRRPHSNEACDLSTKIEQFYASVPEHDLTRAAVRQRFGDLCSDDEFEQLARTGADAESFEAFSELLKHRSLPASYWDAITLFLTKRKCSVDNCIPILEAQPGSSGVSRSNVEATTVPSQQKQLREEGLNGKFDYLAKGDFVYRTVSPIEAVLASGSCLVDSAGKKWIDLEAANGALLFGYDSSIAEECAQAWARIPTVPSFVETECRRRYAHRLGQFIETKLGAAGRLAFELGGAQGIELALRILSQHSAERRTLVVLDGCYHGRTPFISNLSSSFRYRSTLAPIGYRIVRLPVPETVAVRDRLSLKDALSFCKRFAERVFTEESFGVKTTRHSDALALLFEPILNVAGLVDPALEYLSFLADLAKRVSCFTVADEIFTGCYRTGPFLACSALPEPPDFVVMSKALTNGFVPMSVVWSKGDLASNELFPPGTYSTTFANNPLNFIVGNEILNRLEEVRQDQVETVASFLREFVRVIQRRRPFSVSNTKVTGMTAYVEFTTEDAKLDACRRLTEGQTGIVCASTGLSRNRLLFHPPITLNDDEQKEAIASAHNAFA